MEVSREGFEMFCPYCANLLVVEPFGGAMRFACKTCPYHYNIGKSLKKAAHIEQKKVAFSLPVCLAVCPSVFLACFLACLMADWLGLCVSLLSLISLFPPRHTERRVLPILADCFLSQQVDDVLGDGFADAATTDVIGGCPKCGASNVTYTHSSVYTHNHKTGNAEGIRACRAYAASLSFNVSLSQKQWGQMGRDAAGLCCCIQT